MKFLQLTDTHFVPPGEKLYGRDPRRTLNAAVADINGAVWSRGVGFLETRRRCPKPTSLLRSAPPQHQLAPES